MVEALIALIGVIVGIVSTFIMESRRQKWTERRERRRQWEATQQQWLLALQDTSLEILTTLDKYLVEHERAQVDQTRNAAGLWVRSEGSDRTENHLMNLAGRIDTLSSRISGDLEKRRPFPTLIKELSDKLTVMIKAKNREQMQAAIQDAATTLDAINAYAGEILQTLGWEGSEEPPWWKFWQW
jgi:hypothetical protein